MKNNAIREMLPAENAIAAQGATRADIGLIGHVQVSLAAQLGTVSISIEQLFKLKPDDVLDMEEGLEAPVTLMLNGRAVARGELLAVDDHFGIRILELA